METIKLTYKGLANARGSNLIICNWSSKPVYETSEERPIRHNAGYNEYYPKIPVSGEGIDPDNRNGLHCIILWNEKPWPEFIAMGKVQ